MKQVLVCAGLVLTVAACGTPAGGPTGGQPTPTISAPAPTDAVAGPTPTPTTARKANPYARNAKVEAGVDPGVDQVFTTDPVLRRRETHTYRHTEPGDHKLPAGTFTIRYDVSTAGRPPLKDQLAKAGQALTRASGLAVYLDGGTALNDADLAAIQALHRPPAEGGLGLTKLTRLYIYNLKTLPGGKECTPASDLPCAGQTARGGRSPYLWFNGWWDTWVRHLTLDDLEEVKAGSFSNTPFESVSLRAARSIGVMGFGHRPYAKLSVLYLPSVTSIGRDAFRRNQYLVKVNLPRVTKIDDFAFDDTSRLEYVNAPRLVSLGRNALNDTHALKSVNFPVLEYIGINCFDLNGDARSGTGVRVLRLPRLTVVDKNGLTGFGALRHVYAPRLTTAWHDAVTNNPNLATVYAPNLSRLGPRAFRGNPELRAVYLGDQPPTQETDVFVGAAPRRLTIYHSGAAAAWSRFVPAGNPRVPVRQQDE
ncbi:leucine-rich repeat protein [Micromonospora sp. KC723]|uniref:leucine-rich repeat protein n=1 Tax=Micromonospora sp. KC723 TaxID=2530381 RepID=UPI001052FB4E|nr:leucine-rich repeat domain-containing protein [Micromonospora sp. KC723]TDB74759.1 leucine-rich repeat domain-containing protein [Micromonospora sp. KC723]